MKKTDSSVIEALREHAKNHPENSYAQIAATFGLSGITVKRLCADLGRGKNWRRGRRQASPNADKFWTGVDQSSEGCWLWKGCRNDSGYGFVHFDGRSQGAHRVAYMLMRGSIPEGMELDHSCRNRACCNPGHLEPITHAENMVRVRDLQAGVAQKAQHDSSNLIDPHPDIETVEITRTVADFGIVSPLVKEAKLHPQEVTFEVVSVSTGSIGHAGSDRAVSPELEAELNIKRRAKWEREDQLWGLTTQHVNTGEEWATFRGFWMETAGIAVFLTAKSWQDAEAMFASIWGYGNVICRTDVGHPSTKMAVISQLCHWQERLENCYEKWKTTDIGKQCLDLLSRANPNSWHGDLMCKATTNLYGDWDGEGDGAEKATPKMWVIGPVDPWAWRVSGRYSSQAEEHQSEPFF